MKKFLLAGACLAVLSAPALAADLPVKAHAPVVAPLYNWTGFYIGGNAGWGWARLSDSVGGTNLNGFVGGGQIGYNWQVSNFVLGLETDFQGSDQHLTETGTIGATAVTGTARVNWFGTIRGRVGVAANNWLFYVTGGGAYTNVGASLTAAGATVSTSTTKWGGTVGGGVEYGINRQWTVGLEYLYVDTGSQTITVGGVSDSLRIQDNILRAKVNFRF